MAERHVIVDTKCWQHTDKVYASKGVAMAAQKRTKKYNGNLKYPTPQYEVMSVQAWRDGDYEVDTINILNPKAGTFKIRRSQEGTCCDPSTERYHSM